MDKPAPLIPPRTYELTAGSTTFWLHATFAPGWFADATREAEASGPDARRREILLAVCFVESYLLEWVRDDVLNHKYRDLDQYPPSDYEKGIKHRWKKVTKMLCADGRIAAHPDYNRSVAWHAFIQLVGFRNGLVHGRTGRPQTGDTTPDAQPILPSTISRRCRPAGPSALSLRSCASCTPRRARGHPRG